MDYFDKLKANDNVVINLGRAIIDDFKTVLIGDKESGAQLLCSGVLSDAVFTEEYGVLSLRTPEGWLLWHSCKVDGVTLAEILKEAEGNLKKLKETQDR